MNFVDTLIDNILEEEYRYKLLIYQIFLAYESNLVEEGILTDTLEISQFKFSQYLGELVEDLKKLAIKSKIELKDPRVFQGENLSTLDYQKLRSYYFEQSLEAGLLIQVGILQNYTLNEYAQIKFISRGTVYLIVKRLNKYLANWNISLKNNQLRGSEVEIRSFCFQLFFYFYGSNQSFVLRKRELNVAIIINDIQYFFEQNFTANQLSQLRLFLSLQYRRMVQNYFVEENQFGIVDENLLSRIVHWYEENEVSLEKEKFRSEVDYLLSFLVLNGFIKNDQRIRIGETKMFKIFMHVVKKQLPQLEHRLSKEAVEEIKTMCFKWKYFSFSFASFVSNDQFQYFQQIFPRIHRLVYTFVEYVSKERETKLNEFEYAHFYYDFLFCLLQFEQIREIERSIHIFIDFSGGSSYNNFIKINILAFSYLNLVIDPKLIRETDIYVSDFFNEKVGCEQIIWKNPPLDYDWKVFADKVTELKGVRK